MKSYQIALIILLVLILSAVAIFLVLWFVVGIPPTSSSRVAKGGKPNIIIFLADDVGYGDFQTFGHPTQEWTGVDRMAKEGMRFRNWNSPASVCSPSRAALLTGRYPIRAGLFGHPHNFLPASSGGLPRNEITIPEALKEAGYVTGMSGKWHLGVNKDNSTDGYHLPHNHGFDHVGLHLPISQMWTCDPKKYTESEMKVCILYRNDTIVEQPIRMNTLTSRLIDDTRQFIATNKDRPFFYLLSFPQAHPALFASPEFYGKSKRGLYGDSINGMGWAIDEVLDYLIKQEIDQDTLVVFVSDQGPIRDGCGEAGSAGLLRGGKGTTWEGGVRIPAVAWWPGAIEPGQISDATTSTMDLFPTALHLAGLANYTKDKSLLVDGKVIKDIVGETHKKNSQHEILFYYFSGEISAVRYKEYKLHYFAFKPITEILGEIADGKCDYKKFQQRFAKFNMSNFGQHHDPPLIFNVDIDPQESIDLDPNTTEHKLLIETVDDLIQTHKASVISVQSEFGKPAKPENFPCCNPPHCTCNYEFGIYTRRG